MGKILWKYFLKEIMGPFWVSLVVLILILLLGKVMKLAGIIFSASLTFASFSRILFFALPYFLVYAIPMATLLGIHLAFLRMGNDREIIALKASGIGASKMLGPVVLVSIVSCILATYFSVNVLPDADYRLRLSLSHLLERSGRVLLRERVFIDTFPGLILYVNEIDRETHHLNKVLIQDNRKPETRYTIFAKDGDLIPNAKSGGFVLKLENGVITRINDNLDTAQNINFKEYKLILGFSGKKHGQPGRRVRDLSIGQLREKLKRVKPGSHSYIRFKTIIYKRFALPFSCLVLGLIAAPLGMQVNEDTRVPGLATGLAIFLIYYVLMTAGQNLAEVGILSPFVGLWMPNILFGTVGIYTWIQISHDRKLLEFSSVIQATKNLIAQFRR